MARWHGGSDRCFPGGCGARNGRGARRHDACGRPVNYADLLLLLLLAVAGMSGYRKGLVTAVLSLVGAVGGALIGLQIAPALASRVTEQIAKIGISAGLVLVGVLIGQAAGSWLGSLIAGQLTWRPVRAVDRSLGMVGQVLATLAVAWLVALPLAAVPVPWLSAQVRGSAILTSVNEAVPDQAAAVSAKLRNLLASHDFPQILAPLAPAPNLPVAEPDESLAGDPALVAAQASILKVRADAPQCAALKEGTGFVVAPGTIVTNAHVVAGAAAVKVETTAGALPAAVVRYDADVDLAVLKVAGLDAPALKLASNPALTGDDAVVAGYPLDGPYTLSPARVRGEMVLRGPNIYASKTVSRDVYALRGLVRPGNSGGPLLAPDGTVLGVIFGAAVDNPEVGFALTVDQSQPTIAAGLVAREPVDTGACTAK